MNNVQAAADLPQLEVGNLAFHLNPNAAVGKVGGHGRLAQLDHGVAILSYERVKALLGDRRLTLPDARFFEEMGATPPVVEFLNDGLLLYMEPSRHERVRRIMVKGFKPSTIEQARGMMRRFADQLIDRALPAGRCEFVTGFSHHYSIGVISRYIGVPPEDVPTFDHATTELMLVGRRPAAPWMPRLEAALATIRAYTLKLVDIRRRQPAEDLITDLIAAQQSEGLLTENELVWGIANLLLAGHDTTRYQTASCVRAILEAGLWERLAREPALVPAAVEEGMRLYPVTPHLTRIAREEVDIGGTRFAPGQVFGLMMTAAARDPEAFPDPDRMRLDRGGRAWDVGFGRGAHYCLGHAVAKLEMVEAITRLTQRLTGVAFDGEPEFAPPGAHMWGPETLPLRFKPRT